MGAPEQRFKNSRARLDRAHLHYSAFASEWSSLLEKESAGAEARKDKKTGWHTLQVKLTSTALNKIVVNQLALELGEYAYQLRAALDSLMWDAITYTQGAEPPADANRIEFPILNGKIRDFQKCAFHNFPFPKNLAAWLETIQPGTAEKPADHPDRGLATTLEDIHNLARFDRHRRLRVVGAIPMTGTVDVTTVPPGGKVVAHEWLDCDLLDGKYEFLRMKVIGPGGLVPYHLSLKTDIAFQIFAEDIPLYQGDDVSKQLNRFILAVDHVIDKFDSEFV